jgi:DNA-binding MarR family transcriptional regulator
MTPGNLFSHLQKIEDAGYVEVTEEFLDKAPHMALKLTLEGREAFKEYRRNVKRFIEKTPEQNGSGIVLHSFPDFLRGQFLYALGSCMRKEKEALA